MTYRGIEYIKIRGYWRAKPGQGTGERSPRLKRKVKRKPREPAVFWECVNERTGHQCGTQHRSLSSSSRHVSQLDRKAGRVGGRSARTWQAFKVVDGVGYHYGVGAPKRSSS